MLPLFCVRIKPLGRAVSWFGHPVREPGAIYVCCNGLELEFGLTGTRWVRPVEPLSPRFDRRHRHAGTGGARSRWMAARMRVNRAPPTAASAGWNVMARAWRTTRAPILMRRVRRLVSDQNEYGLLAFAATLTIAGRDIVTRKIAAEVPSLIVTLASAIFVGLTGAVVSVVFGSWTQPDTTDLVMIAAAACALLGAYHYSVVAIRLGEISLTAPFRYSVILWGLIVGYLVWGDVPGITSLAGMVLITLVGLYVFHRERLARQRARA